MQIKSVIKNGFIPGLIFIFVQTSYAAATKQPITVNGDIVEFKSEGREMVAQGNVEVVQQDTKLTCDKVRVFIDEKIALAEGHVKFKRTGTEELQGDMIVYDFGSKTGTIIAPRVRMAPYYGKAQLMERLSDTEFVLYDAEISTCDLPHPHYTLRCKEVKMQQPQRLLTAKGVKVSVLDVPLMYVPMYSQRLTDKRPRLMITPGHKKDFGTYLLGSWRYYLKENAKGLLHFDWYQNRGWAEGIDLNYDTKAFGLGNAKYYRIDEINNSKNNPIPPEDRKRKERSKIELRHRWDMTSRDHLVLEYFRQSDVNFRKDYFFREYEKDTNPKSFLLLSHVYPNATLSLLGQPRVNKFESVLEKIPELKLETVNQKIGQTSWYYKNTSSASHLVNTTANVDARNGVSRTDTSNQISYLFRFFDVDFSPFLGSQDTYYSRGAAGKEDLFRNMLFSGADISTKFFKVFDVHSNFMNVDINKLRHIVTPLVQYRYQHKPTLDKSRLLQLDDIDSLDKKNTVTFNLENKLQTKRKDTVVDLVILILSTDYNIERNVSTAPGFQNAKYHLEFKPYPWWQFDSEAEYDTQQKFLKNLTTDFWANVAKVSTNIGYRYKKDESSQLTAGFSCPLNPFWKLGIYERFEFRTGNLVEQEYTLDRDMHCWTMQFILNHRKDEGVTVLLAFKLKAFPEIGINAEKSFRPPRSQ